MQMEMFTRVNGHLILPTGWGPKFVFVFSSVFRLDFRSLDFRSPLVTWTQERHLPSFGWVENSEILPDSATNLCN